MSGSTIAAVGALVDTHRELIPLLEAHLLENEAGSRAPTYRKPLAPPPCGDPPASRHGRHHPMVGGAQIDRPSDLPIGHGLALEDAGLPSTPTTSAGTQYTLADGSLVRIMEPSGQTPLRAPFTNANGGPINPFTGKPVQPPSGLAKAERLDFIRSRTHIELGP